MLRPLATYGPTALIGGATATILAFGSPFPAADLAATLAMAALVCAAQIAMTRHLIAWYERRLDALNQEYAMRRASQRLAAAQHGTPPETPEAHRPASGDRTLG